MLPVRHAFVSSLSVLELANSDAMTLTLHASIHQFARRSCAHEHVLQVIEDDYSLSEGELKEAEEKPDPDIQLGSELPCSPCCLACTFPMHFKSSFAFVAASVLSGWYIFCYILVTC